MWPFRARKDRDQQIRDGFSKFMTPETVKTLVEDLTHLRRDLRPQPARIFFVLAHIRDDGLDNATASISRVTLIAQNCGGMIDQISSLVLITFGIPPSLYADDPTKLTLEHCAGVATALRQELGPKVRVVYGARDGLFGNVGGDNLLHYGALIPDFGDAVDKLLQLGFGQSAQT